MGEAFPKPKLEISDQRPLALDEWRDHPVVATADPAGELPGVTLATGPLNPHDRPRPTAQRVGIHDDAGTPVGAFNLMQTRERSWVNDVRIEEARQGEKLAVASYVGAMAALHELERPLESDPGGLSDDSVRVWESLVRRGVAQPIQGAVDQHGHPRFVSVAPQPTFQ